MTDASGPAEQDGAFWRFSLAFYAKEGVAPACLALQDEAGMDVNLLLYLLFLAAEGRSVSAEDIGALDRVAKPWREEVIEPLRALRRQLKTDAGGIPPERAAPLREKVKRAELEAERVAQGRLEKTGIGSAGSGPGAETAKANLAALESVMGALPHAPKETILRAFSKLYPPL